ncbi:DinB superfamily protein [Paenibacillus uliginis N3/975]|uniref:DinB superfamily protein n=1 Tax=Paenibacillus uliginis N3/975 TaxID=1313296 RepID=A0A1X7GIR4_9BACL|nr:DinB family protein [Paenibacillus uliginis]SMF69685.1 DinB superfamily protein [Paenibacillus uliginis N3/975]
MSQNILNTGKLVHNMALQQIQAIPEELFDIQPPQFNNTIRWHVGHVISSLNYFLSLAVPFNFEIPESYGGLFGTGTRPSEWTTTPPTKEELVKYFSGQLESLAGISPSALEQSLKAPIDLGKMHFETAGELVNFALIHEAMHIGNISSMLKVIQHNQA